MPKVELELKQKMLEALEDCTGPAGDGNCFATKEAALESTFALFLGEMLAVFVGIEQVEACKGPEDIFGLWLRHRQEVRGRANPQKKVCA